MKTHKIISVAALAALLATACSNDNDGRIRLFAERMTQGGNAKVLFDAAHLDAAEWVAGESIDINGNAYTIGGTANDGYSVDGTAITGSALYAIYPATVNDALGNKIYVTNGGHDGICGVDIRSLAVNMHSDGRHDVYFPMAAAAAADATEMTFQHLTGGLKLTLRNTSATDAVISGLVVSATKADGSPAIYRNIAPSWAGSLLPIIPTEHGEDEDQGIQFYSDIQLRMNTDGTPGVTIPAGQSITFCIPMLAQQLKNITVTGYGVNSLIQKTKTLDTPKDIERNKMYTIPVIEFEPGDVLK